MADQLATEIIAKIKAQAEPDKATSRTTPI